MKVKNGYTEEEVRLLGASNGGIESYIPEFYGQHAEDFVAFGLLKAMFPKTRAREWSYIDIGANHPIRNSNTYLFYKRRASGVVVEPIPRLAELFRKHRERDTVICRGAKFDDSESAVFFVAENDQLSTFSSEFLRAWKAKHGEGAEVLERIEVKLIDVEEIYKYHFLEKNRKLYILSIDVEGMDFEVLSRINFDVVKTEILIIEHADLVGVGKLERILDYCKSYRLKLVYKGRVNAILAREQLRQCDG